MCLTKMNVSECNEGDIIASDIYSENGMTLILAKESTLNHYIMARLMNMGINTVCIYKEEDKNYCVEDLSAESHLSYKKIVLLTKDIFQDIISGKIIEYNRLLEVAGQIYRKGKDEDIIIQCLMKIRKNDEYTYNHSINVAFYALLIGRWNKLSKNDIIKTIISGLLHDIGKIHIPDHILNKEGVLTEQEFEIIKKHTILGYKIIEGIDCIDKDIKKAVLLHHERMNGSGYPFGFKAKNINLLSRIVAIADVFDAMTSDRVYKYRNTPFEVFDMFMKEGRKIFDNKILDLFIKNLANNLIGSKVMLNNGVMGVIVYIPYHRPTYPIVRIFDEYIDLYKDQTKKVIKML